MNKRYCYNITFLVRSSRRKEQMEWIARRIEFLRHAPGFCGSGASLSDYGREETSMTAQFTFATAEDARRWGDTHFVTLAGAYSRSFGSDAYAMPSIIEQWEVE